MALLRMEWGHRRSRIRTCSDLGRRHGVEGAQLAWSRPEAHERNRGIRVAPERELDVPDAIDVDQPVPQEVESTRGDVARELARTSPRSSRA